MPQVHKLLFLFILDSYFAGRSAKLLARERGDRVRLEIGSHLLTVNGQDFPIQGPAVAEGVTEEILRTAANSRR